MADDHNYGASTRQPSASTRYTSFSTVMRSYDSQTCLDDGCTTSGPSMTGRLLSRTKSSTFRTSNLVTPKMVVPPTPKLFTDCTESFIMKSNPFSNLLQAPRHSLDSTSVTTSTHNSWVTMMIGAPPPTPDVMHFDAWWHEAGAGPSGGRCMQRHMLTVDFHVAEQAFVIRSDTADVPVNVELRRKDGSSLELWDLHVGAELDIMGRKVVLKRASCATTAWLDYQARSLLYQKRLLEEELSKFRSLVHVEGRHIFAQRCEGMDVFINHRPQGGRENLRGLLEGNERLLGELRQHRMSFHGQQLRNPGSTAQFEALLEEAHWQSENPSGRRTRSRACRPGEAPLPDEPPVPQKHFNYLSWLDSIPLAASAARQRQYVNLPPGRNTPSPPPPPQQLYGRLAAKGMLPPTPEGKWRHEVL